LTKYYNPFLILIEFEMKLVFNSFWIIFFLQFAIIVYPLPSIRISSNFNASKLSPKAKTQLN
jgi:hypothetical protein